MKITDNTGISVRITPGSEPGSIFKNIRPGDIITAFVVKGEGNRAVLEIGGRRITAEFTSGVPMQRSVSLELVSKTPHMVKFALKDAVSAVTLNKVLTDFSVLQDIDKLSGPNLAKFISTSRSDLYAINLFLMGIKKDERDRRDLTGIFNRMLQKGVPMETLTGLSTLIFSNYGSLFAVPFRYLLNMGGNKPEKGVIKLSETVEESIDSFCNLLKENDTDFSSIYDILFDENNRNDVYGEMVFPDEEHFSIVEYIFGVSSVFLNFHFSSAGDVSVLIKKNEDVFVINFFPENDETLTMLKEGRDELEGLLRQSGIKKTLLGYFNSKKIVDKIELWSLDFYTKSKFDIKI